MVTPEGATYAPTTQGGRVRLDAIEWTEKPVQRTEGVEGAGEWYIPVGIGNKLWTVGYFSEELVAQAFLDRYFPTVSLDLGEGRRRQAEQDHEAIQGARRAASDPEPRDDYGRPLGMYSPEDLSYDAGPTVTAQMDDDYLILSAGSKFIAQIPLSHISEATAEFLRSWFRNAAIRPKEG